jgi:hypothetical protein
MSAIRFSVFQTTLQEKPKFLGRVLLQGTYDREAMVRRMLIMGTTLTKTDITAVLQLLADAIEQVCREGYKVNLDGLVLVTPAIGGTFDGITDGFVSPRNSIYLTAQVATSLNARISQAATVEKTLVEQNRPMLAEVIDSEADPGVASLKVGNIISVGGKRLKFNGAQTTEYLRLVNAENPNEYVQVVKFHKMSDQELVFRLPPATYSNAYFELASSLNTTSVRVGRSQEFNIQA